jgi:hypothetical protein
MKFLLLALLSLGLEANEKEAKSSMKKLGKDLKKKLTTAMKEKGPAHAVDVCNHHAMDMTERMNKAGILVGRTSLKIRNPKNVHAKWMDQYLKDFSSGKSKDSKIVMVEIDDKTYGMLKPIYMMPACLKCHGSTADIPQDVQKILKSRYPKDEATGYKVGDFRGFFWSTYKVESKH